MTAPTQKVRLDTYRRDGDRCITCGVPARLEWNHRQSSGMGGSKYKPCPADGVTSCWQCNPAYESYLQQKALECGWKVRRFCPIPVENVPVWYPADRAWFLLDRFGARDRLDQVTADELRALAGILPVLKGGD